MLQLGKPRYIAILILTAVFVAGSIASAAITKSGSFYTVKVETSGSGDSRVAKITTVGKNGYHCNKLYPWKLTITPGDGVTVAKTKLKKGDAKKFEEAAVVFEVPYTAADGAKKVSAKLKLSLCDDKQCQMETVPLSWPAR
ncbi:MAG: hypothetical protein JRF63_09770 [Deltaproteobacteria bacterium]|nr:hypothetical protein [Deltaproteobacteria bacterium]